MLAIVLTCSTRAMYRIRASPRLPFFVPLPTPFSTSTSTSTTLVYIQMYELQHEIPILPCTYENVRYVHTSFNSNSVFFLSQVTKCMRDVISSKGVYVKVVIICCPGVGRRYQGGIGYIRHVHERTYHRGRDQDRVLEAKVSRRPTDAAQHGQLRKGTCSQYTAR